MDKNTKVELCKDVRTKMHENFRALEEIEKRISARIRAEFQPEIDGLRTEARALNDQDKAFRAEAYKLIQDNPNAKFRVVTQVGPNGGTILNEYDGHITSFRNGLFNFSCKDFLDGKEFTIGLSCLQSIEIID